MAVCLFFTIHRPFKIKEEGFCAFLFASSPENLLVFRRELFHELLCGNLIKREAFQQRRKLGVCGGGQVSLKVDNALLGLSLIHI